jgi:beta-lactamase superfamily II metal-dependent hydrolase
MSRITAAIGFAVLTLPAAPEARSQTLDIYFIDVEGGQSTLIVTPERASFLIDTGFAADENFRLKAGDPAKARDANRILAAARTAGIERIDYLMITHFHGDHLGGVAALSQMLPIDTFVDHGTLLPDGELAIPGSMAYFDAYAAIRAKGRHLEPKPGERIPLAGATVTVVSAATTTLAQPLVGAGQRNVACVPPGLPAGDPTENARSTGVLIEYGKFRFLDVGDLSGAPLFALACPNDLIGPVDVYLVAHHGGADSGEPATFAAFRPRVSVMNNGIDKGGARSTYEFLQSSPHAGDTWQLHRSNAAGDANFGDERVANLDTTTAHWIKVSANVDGSFGVTNGRTGETKRYGAR